MRGFFADTSLGNAATAAGRTCTACGLYKGPLSPVMPPAGAGRLGILNVGEAPGETEDKRGKPWQGKVGRVLAKTYRRLGVDLFEDCVNLNSVNCRPPKNRDPSSHEIACCYNKLVRPTLERKRPRVVVLLGGSAVQSVIGLRWRDDGVGGITRWRGWAIPDREWGAWLCPVYHPSFVERENSPAARTIWEADLRRAAALAKNEVSPSLYTDEAQAVEIVEGNEAIAGLLRSLDVPTIAFDYETTGLKPQAEGHRIVSASIATSTNAAYSFVMPESGPARSAFKKLLRDRNTHKMAHNIKFEDTWSAMCLGVTVRGWVWDSMQAAHILDNRPNVSSLKFQVYVNFGVMDYASHITPYLEGRGPGGANAFNRIDELMADPRGRRDLLVYGGLDSLYQFMLAGEQQAKIPPF